MPSIAIALLVRLGLYGSRKSAGHDLVLCKSANRCVKKSLLTCNTIVLLKLDGRVSTSILDMHHTNKSRKSKI